MAATATELPLGDTRLDLGDGDEVTVVGVKPVDLHGDDFLV